MASFTKDANAVEVQWGNETLLRVQNVSYDTSSSVSRYLARIAASQQLYGVSDLDGIEVRHLL